jgi:catechol 2,3-dioxygenase-like lactoylglutathione lyase family enzyme
MASDVAITGEQLSETAPVFRVSDVEAAAAYYRDCLGFSHDGLWGEPPSFCMPFRDEVRVMLDQAADPDDVRPNGADEHGWDAYVWVADAEELFAEFETRGAHIVYDPVLRAEYDMKEFAVRDRDGYVLVFGEDVK